MRSVQQRHGRGDNVTAITVYAENGAPVVSYLAPGYVRNIGDHCTGCGRDTSYGSGLFVNRIPSEWQRDESSPVISGYLCPDCQFLECDKCGEPTIEYSAAPNGAGFWCDDCHEREGAE